jgi:SpoIID/LytB domain protein
MIRKLVFRFLLASLLIFMACLGPVARYSGQNEPVVRIGLLQNLNELRLRTPEKFSLRHPGGRFIRRNLTGGRWLITVKRVVPAQIEYRLLITSTRDKEAARATLNKVVDVGLLPNLSEQRLDYDRLWVAHNATSIYRVTLREKFSTREAALARQKEIADKIRTELWEVVKRPAKGILELKDLETNRAYELPNGTQIIADQIEIPNVPIGTGFHWEGVEARTYRDGLEVFIDRFSKITVVNMLPIETYVKGVVASETHPAFPLEALKAQAVAVRNEIFSKLGTRHLDDGFELCADVHCQVYSGVNKEKETTNQATAATRGLVMKVNGVVIEASYAGVCGGHTENNENVWGGLSKLHLRGIFDGNGRPDVLGHSLQNENTLLRWVQTKPKVYCNITQGETLPAMEYAKKYFRWEVTYTRQELQSLIRKYAGDDIGELRDLVPLERGISGRLVRLRVVGTKKALEISRELEIRKALAEKTLWSACIAIEKSGQDRNGLPAKFKILGAGWGHGVGLCQIGAATMALQGKTCEQILQHYYSGARLVRAY